MAFITGIALPFRARKSASQCSQRAGNRCVRRVRMAAAQQQSIDTAWPVFAEKMKETGEIPGIEEWHGLLDVCDAGRDDPNKAIWVVNLMRETGVRPTAVTYEKALKICSEMDDRPAAFHLVEHMFTDKVLLGDVELPDGMEEILRKILPPEAFE